MIKTAPFNITLIKPGDIIHLCNNSFIVLGNMPINLFGVAYRLIILNRFGDVVVIICGNDQYYDLLVV